MTGPTARDEIREETAMADVLKQGEFRVRTFDVLKHGEFRTTQVTVYGRPDHEEPDFIRLTRITCDECQGKGVKKPVTLNAYLVADEVAQWHARDCARHFSPRAERCFENHRHGRPLDCNLCESQAE